MKTRGRRAWVRWLQLGVLCLLAAGAQGATLTLKATRDAAVSAQNPNTNYGSDAALVVGYFSGYEWQSYIYWNISGATQLQGATINSASIALYGSGTGTSGGISLLFARATTDWTESGLKWGTKPGTSTLITAPYPTGSPSTNRLLFSDNNNQLRNWVQNVVNGSSSNYGVVVLPSSTASAYYNFKSRSNANAEPELVIDYTPAVTYTLTTSVGQAGWGTVSPSGTSTHNSGTTVNVTATPASGYVFSHWSGAASGSTNPLSVAMTTNKSLTANFAVATATVTATLQNVASSSYGPTQVVWSIGAPTASGNPGTVSGVTTGSAQLVLGSQLENELSNPWDSREWWYAAQETFPAGASTRTYVRNLPYQGGLQWRVGQAEITAPVPLGTAVTPRAVVTNGASGTRAVTVELKIARVISGGVSFDNPDYSASASGEVGNSGSVTVALPNFVPTTAGQYRATYRITTAAVDGGTARVTDTGAWADAFTVNTAYTLTTSVNQSGRGTVTPAGATTHAAGSVVNIQAQAAAGMVFTGWSGDATGNINPLAVTMNGNRNIVANFAPVPVSATFGPATFPAQPDNLLWSDTSSEFRDDWILQKAWTGSGSGIMAQGPGNSGALRLDTRNVSLVTGGSGAATATRTHRATVRLPFTVPESGVYDFQLAGFARQKVFSLKLSGVGLARPSYTVGQHVRIKDAQTGDWVAYNMALYHEKVATFGEAKTEAQLQIFLSLLTLGIGSGVFDLLVNFGNATYDILQSGADPELPPEVPVAIAQPVVLQAGRTYHLELETDSFTFAQIFSLFGLQLTWVESSLLANSFSVVKSADQSAAGAPIPEVRGNGSLIRPGSTATTSTNHTDFGATAMNQIVRTFTLHNTGSSSLLLTGSPAVAVHSVDNAFQVSSPPTATTLAPGGSTTFSITFSPGAALPGAALGAVVIPTNTPGLSSYQFALRAYVERADVAVTGSSDQEIPSGDTTPSSADGTDFGTMAVGASPIERQFTIRNLGTAGLSLTGSPRVTISGANAGDFSVVAQPPATVAPNAGATFVVRFTAGGAGNRTADVVIANSDSDESTYTFRLLGVGSAVATPPAAPVALAASALTTTGFSANWSASAGATSYRLDVSSSADFAQYVSGFQNRDVGGVTSATVTGLTAAATYYYRIRAIGAAGVSPASNVISVTTPAPESSALPVVTTAPVRNITATTAVIGGEVMAEGSSPVTTRGYLLGLTPGLTVANSTPLTDGFGPGEFASARSNLQAGTTYFVRAYATNASGTGYGEELQFTTLSSNPDTISDSFSSTLDTTTRWEIVGGTWSTSGGLLTGTWSQSAAYSDQGKLLLRQRDLDHDFDATFVAVLPNGGGHGFSLYDSANNLYNVNVANTGVFVEKRHNTPVGSPFIQIGSGAHTVSATAPTTARLSRRGAVFSVFMNGTKVFEFTDATWSGRLRTGLKTYGTSQYDSYEYAPLPVSNDAVIVVAANPTAGGTVTGGGTFAVGSTRTLTASANTGYTFAQWSDGVTTNPRQIVVPSGGATYTANFAAVPPPDTQGPAVTLGGAVVAANGKSATVSGTATDSGRGGNGVASVTVAGVPASGVPVSGNATANWTATVPLTAGEHTVSIEARDSLSNPTTISGSVTVPAVVTLAVATRTSPASGESYPIQVTANTTWTAASNQTWATVTPASGSGDGTVTVTVAANTSASSRTATITIGGQSHALTQSAPATKSISLALANGGNFGNVTVGASASTTLTLSNPGTSALSVAGIVYPAGYSGNWSAGVINAGASQAVTVTFAPTASQTYTGNLVVNSDATEGANSLALTGTGVPAGGAPTATHALVGTGYSAGGSVTITNTITYTGTATSLGWQVLLPAGWSYLSGGGSEGDVKPAAGTTDLLEWAWTNVPASPATFTYTLQVPAQSSGDQSLAALGIVRQGGAPLQILATPDPLPVPQVVHHSADTDRNFRISLLELTRVIEIYNTRNGSTRTGAYRVESGTEDGFAPDPARPVAQTVTLARHHCADTNRDGRLSLLELTRVIELYNYRNGSTRTGQYRVQSGTEDGFAPGP